jgi:WD40 repeat protein
MTSHQPPPDARIVLRQPPAHAPGGNHLTFSPNGKMLAVGFQTQVKVCDVATGKELAVLKRFKSTEAVICTSLAFSPDGKVLAASDFEWDLKTDNPVAGVLQLWELRK